MPLPRGAGVWVLLSTSSRQSGVQQLLLLLFLPLRLRRYDPERFAPPREEDKVKPFSFIGFGGGRHGCLGSNFAYLQVGAVCGGLCRLWGCLRSKFVYLQVDMVGVVSLLRMGVLEIQLCCAGGD